MQLQQEWPNFLDRGPFSEIWTKARATPHNSIFHYLVDMCYYVLKKALRLTCEKFGSTENKKSKKMATLMMYDGCWIVFSCVWW